MEPAFTQFQVIAAITTMPLIIFIVINAFDQTRSPEVKFGPIKSALYLSLIACGTTVSGVLAYSLAKLSGTITPLFIYSLIASVLSTYLYASKTFTVAVATLLESRKRAKLKQAS